MLQSLDGKLDKKNSDVHKLKDFAVKAQSVDYALWQMCDPT